MRRGLVIALFTICAVLSYRFEWLGADGQTPGYLRPGHDRPGEADRYYYSQRVYPFREAPGGWRERAIQHIDAMTQYASRKAVSQAWRWVSAGPNNIAGRIRALAVDPFNHDILYAGSAGGGIWKTTDAGSTWLPLDDLLPNLRIGSIAVSPHDPSIILAGNGEGYVYWQGGYAYGRGVYRSIDAGVSWELILGTDIPEFEFVFDIAFDPFREGCVLAATREGIFRSTDFGTTWTEVLSSLGKRGVMSVFSQTDAGVVYAALEGRGIYRSLTHGETWNSITTSQIDVDPFTRIYLAAAPSDGKTLYAAFTAMDQSCAGIYYTTNAGENWAKCSIPMNELSHVSYMGEQGMYNSVLTVDPEDPAVVYAGGIDLYKTVDGGQTWRQISNWYSHKSYPYVHADQHAIVCTNTRPGFLYIGNDGGVFVTSDGGSTFSGRNTGLITTQLHSGTPHPYSDVVISGTIDNGNMKVENATEWEVVTGGDGGFTAINYNDPRIMYTELYYLHIMKSTESGAPNSFTVAMDGIPHATGFGTSDRVNFIAPFVMDPNDPDVLYAGSYRVFKTTDGAVSWSEMSPDVANGSVLTTIAVSASAPQTLYTGSANGAVSVTTNGGVSWEYRMTGLPNRYITDIAIHPEKPGTAYVTLSGFNSGHVYKTEDFGETWTDISGIGETALPDVPANSIILHPENTNVLFTGTDVGLFYSSDGGQMWLPDANGIGNVIIADLQFRRDGVLFAATHGRGQYRTNVSLSSATPPLAEEFQVGQNYPNPVSAETNITYIQYDVSTPTEVQVLLYDDSGRLVKRYLRGYQEAGTYSFGLETEALSAGLYFYTFCFSEGPSTTHKMLVLQ